MEMDIKSMDLKEKELVTTVSSMAGKFGFSFSELTQRSKKKELVEARKIIAYVLSEKYGPTDIGFALRRDHSSAIYMVKDTQDLLKYDKFFRNEYSQKIKELQQTFLS